MSKKTHKKFENAYINEVKRELGYSDKSLNITVMNNPYSFGKVLLFGYLSALSMKMYNLSLEEKGLLLIQRDALKSNLLPKNIRLLEYDMIDRIVYKKGLMQNTLVVYSKDRKKVVLKINKILGGVPWHKESLLKIEEIYGKK